MRNCEVNYGGGPKMEAENKGCGVIIYSRKHGVFWASSSRDCRQEILKKPSF
jgi:hypothetical protein